MDQKQELRKRMKEKRDRISPQERRQKSAKICERLLSAPEYARFQKILVYAAIRSEVELQLFCDQALRDRKQIFFPKVCGKEMEFYRIENSGQLKKGMFSVPEPDVKQYPLSSFAENGGGMDSCPRCCIRRKGDAARIRRRILRSLPEAERKSAQDRNCVWRTDRQKNSNSNT